MPEAAEGCHRANGKPSAPSYIAKPDQPHRSEAERQECCAVSYIAQHFFLEKTGERKKEN